MSAWAVTMGAGATIGSCMRGLPCHPEDGLGPKSITVTPEMAKHNRGGCLDRVNRKDNAEGPGHPHEAGRTAPSSPRACKTSDTVPKEKSWSRRTKRSSILRRFV